MRQSILLIYILFSGASDVSVRTDLEVFLEIGSRGLLPCEVQLGGNVTIAVVVWKKGSSSIYTPPLVIRENHEGNWENGGPGYGRGYSIDQNLSLIINRVKIEDDDIFVCVVSPLGLIEPTLNQTQVRVFGEYDQED